MKRTYRVTCYNSGGGPPYEQEVQAGSVLEAAMAVRVLGTIEVFIPASGETFRYTRHLSGPFGEPELKEIAHE